MLSMAWVLVTALHVPEPNLKYSSVDCVMKAEAVATSSQINSYLNPSLTMDPCSKFSGGKSSIVWLSVDAGLTPYEALTDHECRMAYIQAYMVPASASLGIDFFGSLLGQLQTCPKCSQDDPFFGGYDYSNLVAACSDEATKCTSCMSELKSAIDNAGITASEAGKCYDLFLFGMVLSGISKSYLSSMCAECNWGSASVDSTCIFPDGAYPTPGPAINAPDAAVSAELETVFPPGTSGACFLPPPWVADNLAAGTAPDWLIGTECPTSIQPPAEWGCGPPPFIVPCTQHSQCGDAQVCFDNVCMCDIIPGRTGADAPWHGTGCQWEAELKPFSTICDIETDHAIRTRQMFLASLIMLGVAFVSAVVFLAKPLITHASVKTVTRPFTGGAAWWCSVFVLLSLPFQLWWNVNITLTMYGAGGYGPGGYKNARIFQQQQAPTIGVGLALESMGLECLTLMLVSLFQQQKTGVFIQVVYASFLLTGLGCTAAGTTLLSIYFEEGQVADGILTTMWWVAVMTSKVLYCAIEMRKLIKSASVSPAVQKALKELVPVIIAFMTLVPLRLAGIIAVYTAAVTKSAELAVTGFFVMYVGIALFDGILVMFAGRMMRSSSSS